MSPLIPVNYGIRLAHINYKARHVNKVVTGLPDMKIKHEDICKGCAKGKNIKNPFSKSETKTKGTLELIHSDVSGLMSSTSLSGFEFILPLLMTIQEGHGSTS